MDHTFQQEPGRSNDERQKRLIVVADGDAAHLYYTSMLLQRMDYNIHTSKTATDVLEIVDVANPALVLTSIALQGDMNGIELLQALKRSPRTYRIPVIMLTGSRDPATKEACTQAKCAEFILKPVEPDKLYAAIQKETESIPRQFIRLTTALNVIVGDEKTAQVGTGDYISALSENGMFISMSKPRPAGQQVPIMIFLEEYKMQVEGTVLYSFQRGAGPLKTQGIGVKFTRIDPEDQNIIRSFIKRTITKGLTMSQIGGTIY